MNKTSTGVHVDRQEDTRSLEHKAEDFLLDSPGKATVCMLMVVFTPACLFLWSVGLLMTTMVVGVLVIASFLELVSWAEAGRRDRLRRKMRENFAETGRALAMLERKQAHGWFHETSGYDRPRVEGDHE